jgi:hypothetical protein
VATKRTRPLSATDIEVLDSSTSITTMTPDDDDLESAMSHTARVIDPAGEAARLQQLTDGVRRLRIGGGSLNLGERTLMIAGGIAAPLGILIIVLGWVGAANTGYVFEQIPYVISGGLLGISLVFLGAFFYFAHWMTELVKEHRAQSAAIIDALTRLQDELVRQAGADRLASASPNGASGGELDDDPVLVATGNGTMAHRPECVVVAGKPGLRAVSKDDGLASCKMCVPY